MPGAATNPPDIRLFVKEQQTPNSVSWCSKWESRELVGSSWEGSSTINSILAVYMGIVYTSSDQQKQNLCIQPLK